MGAAWFYPMHAPVATPSKRHRTLRIPAVSSTAYFWKPTSDMFLVIRTKLLGGNDSE